MIYLKILQVFLSVRRVLGFFNKISPYRYKVDPACNHCGLCKRKCKMGITPYANPNNMECIRCGECLNKHPKKALRKKK